MTVVSPASPFCLVRVGRTHYQQPSTGTGDSLGRAGRHVPFGLVVGSFPFTFGGPSDRIQCPFLTICKPSSGVPNISSVPSSPSLGDEAWVTSLSSLRPPYLPHKIPWLSTLAPSHHQQRGSTSVLTDKHLGCLLKVPVHTQNYWCVLAPNLAFILPRYQTILIILIIFTILWRSKEIPLLSSFLPRLL